MVCLFLFKCKISIVGYVYLGVLREKNVLESDDDEEDKNDPLQPLKRRRITSIDAKSIDRMTMKYRKRIMCRPPIRRMLNSID